MTLPNGPYPVQRAVLLRFYQALVKTHAQSSTGTLGSSNHLREFCLSKVTDCRRKRSLREGHLRSDESAVT